MRTWGGWGVESHTTAVIKISAGRRCWAVEQRLIHRIRVRSVGIVEWVGKVVTYITPVDGT